MSQLHEHVTGVYLVPGLPHILQCRDQNQGYETLANAFEQVGEDIVNSGAKRILYYSTQWIAVLDQMIQARSKLRGAHVDENWYDYGKLNFDFDIDRSFAEVIEQHIKEAGHKTRLVDYDGFPVDTGTIVADTLLNPKKLPTAIVANNVYCDGEKTEALAKVVGGAIAADKTPTAVVGVSGLSGRFYTTAIDIREDRIRESSDDAWNKTMLEHWEKGQFTQAEAKLPTFAQEARVDMGFKAYAWLRGMTTGGFEKPAKVLGYSAIYGTGGAVVKFAGTTP